MSEARDSEESKARASRNTKSPDGQSGGSADGHSDGQPSESSFEVADSFEVESDAEDPLATRLGKVRRRRGARGLVLSLIATALVVFLAFGVVLAVAVVEGDSMSPALEEGDVGVFLRVGAQYKTGDVVLVRFDEETVQVKRVVALPGQTVDIQESTGALIVDGEELVESYVYDATLKKQGVSYPVTLGEDEYFVLGDNRSNSLDSRNYGPVTSDQLVGKLLFIAFRWEL